MTAQAAIERQPIDIGQVPAKKILRRTTGSCPTCLETVPASVVEDGGAVYLVKECPTDGDSRTMLSQHADYYSPLMDYFFDIVPAHLPQRDYILRLTSKCNMACPICLAWANESKEEDLPVESIKKLVAGRKRVKLDLMGAEPTLRPDLEEIISYAHKGGHLTALHTNGLRFSEPGYLDKLVNAGLDEVHLQMDGFSGRFDMALRGRSMDKPREKALAELKRLDVATDLVAVIMRDGNEDEMGDILDYAAKNSFVKEIFYLGVRLLGRASEKFETKSLVPDELIDMLEEQTNGRVNRADVRKFQKLYFAALAAFSVRKCFYIHHYLAIRTKNGGYKTVAEMMDLDYLERKLDKFGPLVKRSRRLAAASLLFHTGWAVVRKGGFSLLAHGMRLAVLLALGFDLSKFQNKAILLGFITACDPHIHDNQMSACCGKGEVSTDVGWHDAGADANVKRERIHYLKPKNGRTQHACGG